MDTLPWVPEVFLARFPVSVMSRTTREKNLWCPGYLNPYITLKLIEQAPVVQRLDNAIHRINHYPADSVVCLLTLIRWIAIYPVDSVIQPLNNRALAIKLYQEC